ncbi:TPA: Txe/YoeB family addiction module toxin [Salmonella enterica subsp. indica]|uniref:Putative mRNA interferase YoeB n=2 Tax=Salmonella enterica TaxID=28901 RepID=A0A753E2C8_SALER|nr:Txe/YoeB family addiction module toxin [Salmonella enterica subsp. indica serovar 45:a:e,n,x]HAE8102535.1 Txe/YoeB family addiction module toxin [Salmonella enterica subsp. indica serovar 45:a:e,n,x]HAF7948252.1 Txe/YoeB family addiction module toxin [Salmonella enterica subsp. indica]
MKVRISPQAKSDLQYWAETDPKTHNKVMELIKSAKESPFKGIGKPEALKHRKPLWSHRITKEHRLVYYVEQGDLYIVACRYHYTTI